MSYCISPGCLCPQNTENELFCKSCATKLLLKDRYRALQPISQGGFGKTFLAIDEHIPSKPECVIKQLYYDRGDIETFNKVVSLFHQEADRLEELGKHPQIPHLLAHFEQNQQLYLVQELIVGTTLSGELKQNGVYSENQIWELLQNMLPILQYVHEHHVIHRDIKPANIMRRSSDRLPVLIDFGVAKLLTGTALLHTGTIIGSPDYMPPEQTRGKVLPASDLYSLGVTCIYLITGVSPLDMFDIVEQTWGWRQFLPKGTKISDRLGLILDKLIHSSLKDRYQSASQVLRAVNLDSLSANNQPDAANVSTLPIALNYTKLQELLASGKWKLADRETWALLCQSVNKSIGCYLFNHDIEKFPCEHLYKIDRLWVKYSQGRFGFSVQKQIYESVEGEYQLFCDRIGWPAYNPSVLESMMEFSSKAPVGHLPSRQWVGGSQWWRHAGAIAARLEYCAIS